VTVIMTMNALDPWSVVKTTVRISTHRLKEQRIVVSNLKSHALEPHLTGAAVLPPLPASRGKEIATMTPSAPDHWFVEKTTVRSSTLWLRQQQIAVLNQKLHVPEPRPTGVVAPHHPPAKRKKETVTRTLSALDLWSVGTTTVRTFIL